MVGIFIMLGKSLEPYMKFILEVKMKKIAFLFSYFLIISISTYAQTLNIGFNLEGRTLIFNQEKYLVPDIFVEEKTEESILPLPTTIHLKLGIQRAADFTANLYAGYAVVPDFSGPEAGIDLRYETGGIELILPYLIHFNDESGSTFGEQSLNTIHLLGAGIGAKISRIAIIELVYLTPVSENNYIGSEENRGVDYTNKYLKSLISLGVSFNWSISEF